jgi:hypothetical protein
MVKKVSLEISDDVYEQLTSLSETDNQEINETVLTILSQIG